MTNIEIKDSGERQIYQSGAQRDNSEGKGRYDLIPTQLLMRLARHYELGARKYTRKYQFKEVHEVIKWLEESYAETAEKKLTFMLETDVETVMKNGLDKIIQNMLNDKEKMLDSGIEKILTKFVQQSLNDKTTPIVEQETLKQKENGFLNKEVLIQNLLKNLRIIKRENVLYANDLSEKSLLYILTMTTQQKQQEEYCVVVATTDLDFLKTIYNFYNQQLNIFNPLPQTLSLVKTSDDRYLITLPGDRNWEQGMPISRYADAAMRHLIKYIDGWDDEDHLAGVFFNLAAIMHHEKELPEMQDLPKWKNKKSKFVMEAPKND